MKYFTCESRSSAMYKYHIRLLMHFTDVKPLNLPHYLYKTLVKMAKKVQNRKGDHQASFYHHALIKIIVLHQLEQMSISWETFMQSTVFLPSTSQPTKHSTPPASSKSSEVSSCSRVSVKKTPRAEITQTYIRGKRLVFSPREKERAKPTLVHREASPHHHETSFHEHIHEKQGKSFK